MPRISGALTPRSTGGSRKPDERTRFGMTFSLRANLRIQCRSGGVPHRLSEFRETDPRGKPRGDCRWQCSLVQNATLVHQLYDKWLDTNRSLCYIGAVLDMIGTSSALPRCAAEGGCNPRNAGTAPTVHITGMLQRRVGLRSHPNVTVTPAKSTVTAAALSKIRWQAGMLSQISDRRGYVRLQATKFGESRELPNKEAGKSEKHAWQAGMYKAMNSLAGYVDRDGRENWDFREILLQTER
jgi:hypothetical protein